MRRLGRWDILEWSARGAGPRDYIQDGDCVLATIGMYYDGWYAMITADQGAEMERGLKSQDLAMANVERQLKVAGAT